ncbi:MAG: hypothetical protein HC913_17115 [Microscillaceae bacterium]|nr:hypothetical protein [Microscillaceae bacterium]
MGFILIFWLIANPVTYIATLNHTQRQAQRAFQAKKYAQALRQYEYLVEELHLEQGPVLLNLAHCYFVQKKADRAHYYYQKALLKTTPKWQSIILTQLGYLAILNREFTQARQHFQQALLSNSANETARYNLELLLKQIKAGLIDVPLPPQAGAGLVNNATAAARKSQSMTEPQESGSNPRTFDRKEEAEANLRLQPQKLEEIKLNREKAEAILDALRNQEIQYIQQIPPPQTAPQNPTPNRPDW